MTQTLHFAEAMLPTGWAKGVRLHLAGGKIESIETDTEPRPGEARHAVALPGLPNLHSHAFQRGMAGLAERRGQSADSFWTWREIMYRFVDQLTPDDMMAIAAMAYAEMLEGGFTRVGEFHYLHHDPSGAPYAGATMAEALAAAATETGIALTLLPVFYAHAGFGGQTPSHAQRRFICSLDQFTALREASRAAISGLPDAVLGLAPHSLRAVTPDQLTALAELAGTSPIHIHVAEQQAEVEACLAWSRQRPVAWLLDHAPVGPNWCLVHATHMTSAETRALAQSGAVAGLCPITEANLGDGVFPAPEYLSAGGRFGVGSDSNVRIDAAEELRWLEYGQRLSLQSRNVFAGGPDRSTGAALFGGAVAGGALALGAGAGIAEGLPADFLTLQSDHPACSADQWLDQWLFAAPHGAVNGVWRAGQQVVSAGRHVARDAIVARYRTTIARLLA